MYPTLQIDTYKNFHPQAYHPDVTEVYSNFTNRNGKYAPNNKLGGVVNVGIQYFIKDYLLNDFSNSFFNLDRKDAVASHQRILSAMLGYQVDVSRLEELHDLGYLPLVIKTLPEGTIVPYGLPSFTVASTKDGFQWLTNAIETVMSSEIWMMQTSATTAANYRLNFLRVARKCGIPEEFVMFQGHDFSFRGMPGRHAAAASGFGHLTSFAGTDTVPAVLFAERYYNANVDTELVGASVNATEHSVTCSWQEEGELAFYRYLMHEVAPEGILSLVFDTWDFWGGVANILPELKEEILARDGQIVIRPDSGDPVEILCGINVRAIDVETEDFDLWAAYVAETLDEEMCDCLDAENPHSEQTGTFGFNGKVFDVVYSPDLNRHDKTYYYIDNYGPTVSYCTFTERELTNVDKGLVESLWDIFGGTEKNGYKFLNEKIGAIYGDSITIERQLQIQERLMAKGFAPTVVLGIGSYTYQMVTRDTHGSAVKATSVVKAGERMAIFKDPKTDPGKKSAKGLLAIYEDFDGLQLSDDVSEEEERGGLMEEIFRDGKLIKQTSLVNIRNLINSQLEGLI